MKGNSSPTPTTAPDESSRSSGAADGLAGVAPVGVMPETVAEPVKSMLPIGAFMTADHRYYFNGEGPYPSVTTVLGVLDKPAVVQWKARETAKVVISQWAEVCRLITEEGQDKAVNWAVKESDKARDTAARLGSGLHLLADMVARAPQGAERATEGFQVSEQEKPYLAAFRGFLDRYSASSIVSSEKAVLSANGYAGTYDLLMLLPTGISDGAGYEDTHHLWLIDIKTSKGFYPEYGLQLAAYRWADSIILPGDPKAYPMPEVKRTGVLHLRPDQYPDTGWRLIEYPTDYQLDYLPFLGALEVYQWQARKRFSKQTLNRR